MDSVPNRMIPTIITLYSGDNEEIFIHRPFAQLNDMGEIHMAYRCSQSDHDVHRMLSSLLFE